MVDIFGFCFSEIEISLHRNYFIYLCQIWEFNVILGNKLKKTVKTFTFTFFISIFN